MELTAKERLMLVELKEEIRKLTTEILELIIPFDNSLEIQKRITSILSKLNTIASFSETVNDKVLIALMRAANELFDIVDETAHMQVKLDALEEKIKQTEKTHLEAKLRECLEQKEIFLKKARKPVGYFCNLVNSIRFDFTKRGLKIKLPEKIDISIFRT